MKTKPWLSRKLWAATTLSIIGIIFALTDKLAPEQVWGQLGLVWLAYGGLNVLEKFTSKK